MSQEVCMVWRPLSHCMVLRGTSTLKLMVSPSRMAGTLLSSFLLSTYSCLPPSIKQEITLLFIGRTVTGRFACYSLTSPKQMCPFLVFTILIPTYCLLSLDIGKREVSRLKCCPSYILLALIPSQLKCLGSMGSLTWKLNFSGFCSRPGPEISLIRVMNYMVYSVGMWECVYAGSILVKSQMSAQLAESGYQLECFREEGLRPEDGCLYYQACSSDLCWDI